MRRPQAERLGMGSGPQSEGRWQRTARQYTLATLTAAAGNDCIADDGDDYCCRRRRLLSTTTHALDVCAAAQRHTGTCSVFILINNSKRQRPGRGQLDCAPPLGTR